MNGPIFSGNREARCLGKQDWPKDRTEERGSQICNFFAPIFHVFGSIIQFERQLISEQTQDGIVAARAKGRQAGRQPLDMSKVDAAIKLVEARISPTEAARQLGIGRTIIYREMRRLSVERLI